MLTTKLYGRIKITLPENASRAEMLTPDGETRILAVYNRNDADFTYDDHGYETVTLRGKPHTPQRAKDGIYCGRMTAKYYRRKTKLNVQALTTADLWRYRAVTRVISFCPTTALIYP